MKKKILALLACVTALCVSLALVGCGGGGGGEAKDPSANFVGTWTLTGMEENGEAMSQDDLDLMASMGLSCDLVLNEDKSGQLVIFGEGMDLVWQAKDASTVALTAEGETIECKLADGVITLEESGTKLFFAKGEAKAPAAPAASSSAATSGTEPVVSGGATMSFEGTPYTESDKTAALSAGTVIANDGICTIVAKKPVLDAMGTAGYPVLLFNNSDQPLYFTTDDTSFSVNGAATDDVLLSMSLQVGEYAEDFFWLNDFTDVADLVNVVGILEVWNDDSLETLGVYDFKM